jgi:hypothetical protein
MGPVYDVNEYDLSMYYRLWMGPLQAGVQEVLDDAWLETEDLLFVENLGASLGLVRPRPIPLLTPICSCGVIGYPDTPPGALWWCFFHIPSRAEAELRKGGR